MLNEHPGISGIILDSHGGRIYEGRKLSRLIFANNLNTYSLIGCYSACTTAFISGENRYLSAEANLGFHQYKNYDPSLNKIMVIKSEQEKDLQIFKKQGIDPVFLDKIFSASPDDFWFPSFSELLGANVINGVVNKSELMPVDNKGAVNYINKLDKELLKDPAYETIKKYNPNIYQELLTELNDKEKSGATDLEMRAATMDKVSKILIQSLPRSSNQALIDFTKVTIKSLEKLSKLDSFACLKYLYPKEYGSIDVSYYFSQKEIGVQSEAINLVILDAYKTKAPEIDSRLAEKSQKKIFSKLGEDANYLNHSIAKNKAEYKRSCDVVIKYYKILINDDYESTANYLRWSFSAK